jgi:hypothetical protein
MKKQSRQTSTQSWRKKYTGFTGHVIYNEYSLALPKHAALIADHLSELRGICATILADENFLTLLEAEQIKTIPEYLKQLLDEARGGHEID